MIFGKITFCMGYSDKTNLWVTIMQVIHTGLAVHVYTEDYILGCRAATTVPAPV